MGWANKDPPKIRLKTVDVRGKAILSICERMAASCFSYRPDRARSLEGHRKKEGEGLGTTQYPECETGVEHDWNRYSGQVSQLLCRAGTPGYPQFLTGARRRPDAALYECRDEPVQRSLSWTGKAGLPAGGE